MNNSSILSRLDFVKKGMLTKSENAKENDSLISKFRNLNKIYDNFLLDTIIVGNTTISINGETKFTLATKEVIETPNKYTLSAVVAMTKNNVIGVDGELPWGKQKADMRRFVELTKGNTVIVGRKTFESFGSKPLKDRFHIIVTNNFNYKVAEEYKNQCAIVHSIPMCLELLDKMSEHINIEQDEKLKAFVIGGGEIYKQFMPYLQNIFLTKIMLTSIDGDTFFPNINMNEFIFSENVVHLADEENQSDYHFRLYEKVKTQNRKKEISRGIVKQILLGYYVDKNN